ncbi:MAG: hypothetical protein K2L11_03510 [Muribaculaceae bacterium]|nr:hypothetical protein [Muribaculaceae bacterium]
MMRFRDAVYGRVDSGPSGLGPVGMDVPDASFVCIEGGCGRLVIVLFPGLGEGSLQS